jgi:hypothetical protein
MLSKVFKKLTFWSGPKRVIKLGESLFPALDFKQIYHKSFNELV